MLQNHNICLVKRDRKHVLDKQKSMYALKWRTIIKYIRKLQIRKGGGTYRLEIVVPVCDFGEGLLAGF